MKRKDLWVSVDLEADGPLPGVNNMMSFGAAFYRPNGAYMRNFGVNLKPIPGCVPDPKTMDQFWRQRPAAYTAATTNQQDPTDALTAFIAVVREQMKAADDADPGVTHSPVMICYPAGFDFTYMYWYLHRFLGTMDPFTFSCIDLKSVIFAHTKIHYRQLGKRHMPKHWFPDHIPHTHVAHEDAMEQGFIAMNVFKEIGLIK